MFPDTVSRIAILVAGALCLVPRWPALGWPGVPAWVALVAGAAVALTAGHPWIGTTRRWTPRLLALSVIGLGADMDLRTVAVVGLQGFGYTLAGIGGTLALAALLGRWLAVRRATATLIGVGTAICGGSAIAAVAPAIGADDDDTSAALAIVFLLNSVALLLFPPLGHALGLSGHAFGVWAALAIHDTSSVVGAASTYGREALVVATTMKLARALWIVPVTLAAGAWAARQGAVARGGGRAKRPWFILGFLGMAALVSFLPTLRPAGGVVALAARRLLVLTLFLLGLGLSRQALARIGARALWMGVLLWLLVVAGTIGAIRAGWIG